MKINPKAKVIRLPICRGNNGAGPWRSRFSELFKRNEEEEHGRTRWNEKGRRGQFVGVRELPNVKKLADVKIWCSTVFHPLFHLYFVIKFIVLYNIAV